MFLAYRAETATDTFTSHRRVASIRLSHVILRYATRRSLHPGKSRQIRRVEERVLYICMLQGSPFLVPTSLSLAPWVRSLLFVCYTKQLDSQCSRING